MLIKKRYIKTHLKNQNKSERSKTDVKVSTRCRKSRGQMWPLFNFHIINVNKVTISRLEATR